MNYFLLLNFIKYDMKGLIKNLSICVVNDIENQYGKWKNVVNEAIVPIWFKI